MTEQEWVAGKNLPGMLQLLRAGGDERKMRLFACACCRQVWPLLPDPRSRRAVHVAEQYADGQTSRLELVRAGGEALDASGHGALRPGWAAYWTASREIRDTLTSASAAAMEAAARAAVLAARAEGADQEGAWTATLERAAEDQVHALKDLLDNPFQPAPRLDPGWLTHHDDIVLRMAHGIYDEHAFDAMPVLGDALEEAGCTSQAALEHCRSAQPHYRGCWVLDWILLRE